MSALPSRRDVLKTGAALAASAFVPPFRAKRVASINTAYYLRSHAYHIAGRFMRGYPRDSKFHVPQHYVHSLYVDQTPDNDLSKEIGRDFDVRVTRTIADALMVDGKLAVEGVLLIGEHGNYPRNEKGQILYPRYEFMDQIVEVFRKTGQSVPVFNDKHLSYTYDRAKKMVAWSSELKRRAERAPQGDSLFICPIA